MGISIAIIGLIIRLAALVKAIILLKKKRDWRTYGLAFIIAFSFVHMPLQSKLSFAIWDETPWYYLLTFIAYSVLCLLAVHFTNYYVEIFDSKNKALQQYMRVFDQFMRATPFGCYIIQDGRIVFANASACDMSGYSLNELKERTFWDLAPPTHSEQLKALVTLDEDEAVSVQTKVRLQTRSGDLYWGLATFGRVEYENRPAVAGTIQDITDRIESEMTLRNAQERLRMAMEASNIYVWELNLEDSELYTQAPQLDLPADLIPVKNIEWVRQALHPEEVDRVMNEVYDAIDILRPISMEHRFRDTDGNYQWWLTQAKPYRSDDRRTRRLIGSSQIITERKIAEAQIQRQLHQLEAIYKMVDGVNQANDFPSIYQAASDSLNHALKAHAIGILTFNFENRLRFNFSKNIAEPVQELIESYCNLESGISFDQPSIFPDLAKSEMPEPWRDAFLRLQVQALGFFPLASQGRVLGMLTVCCRPHREATEEYIELTKRIADHLALAIAKQQDQQALQESESQNRAILHALPDMVFRIDAAGTYLDVVRITAQEKLFAPLDEIVGKKVTDVASEAIARKTMALIQKTLDTNELQIFEYSHEFESGRPSYFEARFARYAENEVLVIVRDITERRLLQQTIVDISARQQRRIGQDLHDELGQLLTGIGFRIAGLEQALTTSDSQAAQDAGEINKLVEQAIAQTRLLAEGLNPLTLDVHGLQAGLERIALNTEKLYALDCKFQGDAFATVSDEDVGMHVYRIAQEAVNNAVKHGNPSSINISLRQLNGMTELRIEDDGIGFDFDEKQHEGHGLRIMKYRASIIGADFNISPGASGGTIVSCTFKTQEKSNGSPSPLLQFDVPGYLKA